MYSDMKTEDKKNITKRLIEILESSTGVPRNRITLRCEDQEKTFVVDEDAYTRVMLVVAEFDMSWHNLDS